MPTFPPASSIQLVQEAIPLTPWADNFVPIIPVDLPLHTDDYPFCWWRHCPCHQNLEAVRTLRRFYQEGLVSRGDLKRIYRGQTV